MSATVESVFARAKAERRGVLIGYLPVGFPDVETSITAMRVMVESGVDIVEVGVPYSDPVIDGPTIQAATEQALSRGARVRDVFPAVRAIVDAGAPALVMTYWNLVERYGVDQFAAELAHSGGAGLITPDLIPEEAAAWFAASKRHNLHRVFLVAPSSSPHRIAATAAASSGFVYVMSVMGVTGERERASVAAPELVSSARPATSLPLGVGLGVSTGDQAGEVASYADAVIVGSALVRCLLDNKDAQQGLSDLSALVRELAEGVRRPGIAATVSA